ncbi:MAG: hypothetical protein KJ709_00675 [Nanoarchaeota archaeon]|nr:hypothetical protein [Nanoarchaeota archaeon]
MRRAQAWSTDVMVASGIFLLGVIIFMYVIGGASQTRVLESLMQEGNLILDYVMAGSDDDCSFIDNNILDEDMLSRCANQTYTAMKRKVGSRYDFCIYFEDEDGNLINISHITKENSIGVGDTRLRYMVDGTDLATC